MAGINTALSDDLLRHALRIHDLMHLPGATHKMCLAKMGTRTLFGCGDHYAHISKLLEPVKPRQTDHDD